MKRHPFVLVEVLLAITLLTLSVFPLLSEPLYLQKGVRDRLFTIELERAAEQIYYEILQKKLELADIQDACATRREYSNITIAVPGLGKKQYPCHYHLYSRSYKKKGEKEAVKKEAGDPVKVHIGICIDCPNCNRARAPFPYQFTVVARKVADKASSSPPLVVHRVEPEEE